MMLREIVFDTETTESLLRVISKKLRRIYAILMFCQKRSTKYVWMIWVYY